MVYPNPHRPNQFVGGVLGTVPFPENLVEALTGQFLAVWEEGGALSMKRRTVWGVHSLLGHLTSGVDPVPGLERLTLLGGNQDGAVHLLHSLFSVPVGLYYSPRWFSIYLGELLYYGLPPVVEIPVEAFMVRRSIRSVPQADHVIHLEGVAPPVWKSMPCEMAVKILAG